jgi:hypothetical protein
MRVPNTGLDVETRQIIREGYRLAERLMRTYRDPEPPRLVTAARTLLATVTGLYRTGLRG